MQDIAYSGVVVYILPTFILQVQFIGGPNVGFRPSLEVAGAIGSESCQGLELAANWGIQITLGASIHISFVGRTLYSSSTDPFIVFSAKGSLDQGNYVL